MSLCSFPVLASVTFCDVSEQSGRSVDISGLSSNITRARASRNRIEAWSINIVSICKDVVMNLYFRHHLLPGNWFSPSFAEAVHSHGCIAWCNVYQNIAQGFP